MDCLLDRTDYTLDGVFGVLTSAAGDHICYTLEHGYEGEAGPWAKLPLGTYTCQRGPHRLHGMVKDFDTFEVLNVPGRTGILFHWGNYNKDSDGCILVGDKKVGNMVTSSRKMFAQFMALQAGVDTFTLTVRNKG